jgi:hypothetical protein
MFVDVLQIFGGKICTQLGGDLQSMNFKWCINV